MYFSRGDFTVGSFPKITKK